jgi:hypothetical protein
MDNMVEVKFKLLAKGASRPTCPAFDIIEREATIWVENDVVLMTHHELAQQLRRVEDKGFSNFKGVDELSEFIGPLNHVGEYLLAFDFEHPLIKHHSGFHLKVLASF